MLIVLEKHQLIRFIVPLTCPSIERVSPKHWSQLLINLMDTPDLTFCGCDMFVQVLWNKIASTSIRLPQNYSTLE